MTRELKEGEIVFGMKVSRFEEDDADDDLKEDYDLSQVLHLPGHSTGSIALHCESRQEQSSAN